jgi:hypothetical protein
MTGRRWAVVACIALAVLFAVAPLGRWERGRADRQQLDRIAETRALVGNPLKSSRLAAYRLTTSADCLLYRFGGNPFSVELCWDAKGRLVQTIDRRSRPETKIASIGFDPSLDRSPDDTGKLFELFQELGAIPRDTTFGGQLPLAGSIRLQRQVEPGDTGPILARRRPG